MMLLLFGFALSNTPANVPWAVLDRSTTAQSRRLVEDDPRHRLLPRRPPRCRATRQGRELLRRGDALAVLVIPDDFRRDVVRGDARRCSCCSTAPTPSRRRASAAT